MDVSIFYVLIILNYLLGYSSSQTSSECDQLDVQRLCLNQDTCDSCLQAHVCCHFCYDKNYTERRCNVKKQLLESKCPNKTIENNFEIGQEILKKDSFTIIKEDTNMEEIVQIQPQHVHLRLRKGVPTNVTFLYKPAENYPLDLYYLGDLSISMSKNMKIFKSLGKDLPGNLTQLTKNYKLAYGSFVDKPGMPFYFTDKETYENPCHTSMVTCEKGYSFKHRLDFTKDTDMFLEKVEASQLTANVDDLDGALDALLQILLCDQKIGFSKSSRRIILLPTDSLLHSAGDGILVGAALKPTDKCLLDEDGNHAKPLVYDYPSLEEIELLLRQKKANIIFAVKTQAKLYYYSNMTSDSLKGFAFVGELEEQSENILELIRNGFYSFAETVSFNVNTTFHEHFEVKIFADCERRGIFNETSTCYGVKNEPVPFKVQVTLNEIPPGKLNDVLYVEEKSINEKLELSVEYLGSCQCSGYEYSKDDKCENGLLRCGLCECQSGWTGDSCSEVCNDFDSSECRSFDKDGNPSKICNWNGECTCGKCVCDASFTGKYCEFECPSKRYRGNLIVCSGPNQGKCLDGKCVCEKGFSGDDCSCPTSQKQCSFDGGDICSGKGECDCNKCKCSTGFIGDYCEQTEYSLNNTICDAYEKEVIRVLMENVTNVIKKGERFVKIVDETEKEELSCGGDAITICKADAKEKNSFCVIEYCYYKSEENSDTTIIAAKKLCTMTAGMKAIYVAVLALVAVLVLGVLLILSCKYRIYRADRAEYEKFKNASKQAVEMNPIYKSPVIEYSNPLRTKTD